MGEKMENSLNEEVELLYEKYLKERNVLAAQYKYKLSKGQKTRKTELAIKIVTMFLHDIENTINNSRKEK